MDKGEKERRSVSTPREVYPLRLFSRGCTYESHGQHTHTHTRLTALCPGLPGWAGTRNVKPIWILLKQETVSGIGISWAICKSARRSRQITMPAPHHSRFFTGRMPFLAPNQQRQSTEGTRSAIISKSNSQSNLCSKNCVLLFVICCGMWTVFSHFTDFAGCLLWLFQYNRHADVTNCVQNLVLHSVQNSSQWAVTIAI